MILTEVQLHLNDRKNYIMNCIIPKYYLKVKYINLIYCNIYRLIKNKESPELEDLRKKLSETQEQLELGLDKCQKAEEDATEKAEQVTFYILNELCSHY